ncbi:MAG: T9SS type A sorting domain-containing protein [Bacteroidia bacterium]|nr:T9SS type A sorting domain-containing protein [Bacteroidia bacterium]
MKGFRLICCILIYVISVGDIAAQYAGPVGSPTTTAIYRDSSILVNWAIGCSVVRGYRDIAVPDSGFASYGADSNAIGRAGESGFVSLGDRGEAVLRFQHPIMDGPGPDFAVFENAFNDGFLELAFVEVSSNGTDFYRFPAVSNTQTQTQIATFDDSNDATKLHNLAGKYRANYGTPFDLAELPNYQNLDKNSITHVKIIDVVGSIDQRFASYDQNGHPINDPYPTNFESGGFDLDAVGVIHQNLENYLDELSLNSIVLFPNPATDYLWLSNEPAIHEICLYQLSGNFVCKAADFPINIQSLAPGLYYAVIKTKTGRQYHQKIIKN